MKQQPRSPHRRRGAVTACVAVVPFVIPGIPALAQTIGSTCGTRAELQHVAGATAPAAARLSEHNSIHTLQAARIERGRNCGINAVHNAEPCACANALRQVTPPNG